MKNNNGQFDTEVKSNNKDEIEILKLTEVNLVQITTRGCL